MQSFKGSMIELITQTSTNLPPDVRRAMADAVLRLDGNAGLRRSMGRNGTQFVDAEFSRRVWADRYLMILDHSRRAVPDGVVTQPDPLPQF